MPQILAPIAAASAVAGKAVVAGTVAAGKAAAAGTVAAGKAAAGGAATAGKAAAGSFKMAAGTAAPYGLPGQLSTATMSPVGGASALGKIGTAAGKVSAGFSKLPESVQSGLKSVAISKLSGGGGGADPSPEASQQGDPVAQARNPVQVMQSAAAKQDEGLKPFDQYFMEVTNG